MSIGNSSFAGKQMHIILNIQTMINPCLGCFMVPCRTSKQKKVVILTFDTNFRTHRNLILLACPVLWNWSYRLCIKKPCVRIILSKTNSVHIDSETFKYSYRKLPSCSKQHPVSSLQESLGFPLLR